LILAVTTVIAEDAAVVDDDPLGPGLLGFSFDEGLQSDSNWLKPGKADFLFRRRENQNELNGILWGPAFKGGFGTVDPDGAGSTEYFGGYLRPFHDAPERGELILGGHFVGPSVGTNSYELQAEHRLPCGLGLGVGMVERTGVDTDVLFAKMTYRDEIADTGWNYILAVLGQQVDREESPGGYAALYNDQLMGVAGTDGEQWRGTFGYVMPKVNEWLRPGFEVLYVDNSIGDINGPKFLFINATLQFTRGFLSHPARLGRAMGPQGLEYGNPLGYLRPTWNRRLDVWELGRLVDYRLVRLDFPNGAISEKHEVLVFPFNVDGCENFLDYLFVGAMYDRNPLENSPGVSVGLSGMVGFLDLSAAIEWATETDDVTTTVGFIDWF
jgi:hypothetical protein